MHDDNERRTPELQDYLMFRHMVSLQIMRALYVVGAVLITVAGMYLTLQRTWMPAFYGFGILILGNLAWRLVCEGIIVVFSTHELLADIRYLLARRDRDDG